MPEQASNFAFEVDLFYLFLIALTTLFTIGIAAAAIYFLVKYRRRSQGEIPEQIEGAMKLEITWTVIPFLISMFIFAWGAKLYYQMYTDPKDALEIFVTGKQWMWRAQHQDGQREINELHVPVGRKVKLTMTSEDVLHAYYIPAFRTKTDVVPGRYTMTWFTATKPGAYHLFCAEYCGTKHSGMIGTIYALEPGDYENWLTTGSAEKLEPAVVGREIFTTQGCVNCHKEDNSGRAPTLVGVYGKSVKLSDGSSVVADDAYIRESIVNPHAKTVAGYPQLMSTYQGLLNEEQILYLNAYIKSLATKETEALAPTATAPAAPAGTAKPAKPKPAKPAAKPVTTPQQQ
jgi:cytochrome c oxidase subunit 2